MNDLTSDIMTSKLITVATDDSIRKAYQLMRDSKIRHLPVTDRVGLVIGILSDRDVNRAMEPKQAQLMMDGAEPEFDSYLLVRDFMSWPVQSISEDTPVEEVAMQMLESKISAILVTGKAGCPRGIVTTDDLLKLLVLLLNQPPVRLRATTRLRDIPDYWSVVEPNAELA